MSETQREDEQKIEITHDKYGMLTDAFSQCISEDWFPVVRRDNESVEARPVDRQDGRDEGERTESDRWLIREDNGETYTVSDEVFGEKYEPQGSLRTERFTVDLSWDGTIEDDGPHEEVEIRGWNAVAEVVALIDVRTQGVKSFDVVRVDMEQDNWRGMDDIPLELLYDSPTFNRTEGVGDDD